MTIIKGRSWALDRWRTAELIIIGFWYVSLFPGRIGYDYVQLSQIIRNGKSTDWWSPLYFWVFKLLTFNASTIAVISFVQLIILYLVVNTFMKLFEFDNPVYRISRILIFSTPLFGAFAVNVTHDVTLTAGVILLCALNFKDFGSQQKSAPIFYVFSYLLLLTSFTGIPIIIVSLLIHAVSRNLKILVTALCSLLLIMMPVIATVDSKNQDESKYFTLIADMKCIVQHPDAQLDAKQSELLSKLSASENWKTGENCRKSVPAQTNWSVLEEPNNLRTALSVLAHYPILTLSAHIQRTAGVLPPPFPGPDNQIDYSSSQSLGVNTNVAIQDGPQVLHISIDDPVYADSKLSILKPFESLAQVPIYLVNQSSWLWGWGGFWLIFLLVVVSLRPDRKLIAALGSLYPILLIHGIVFTLTAEALPRYLMASILLGYFSLLLLAGLAYQHAKEWVADKYEG